MKKKIFLYSAMICLVVISMVCFSLIPNNPGRAYPEMATPTVLPTQAYPLTPNDLIHSNTGVPLQVYGNMFCHNTQTQNWIEYDQSWMDGWPWTSLFLAWLYTGTGPLPACYYDYTCTSGVKASWDASSGSWTWNGVGVNMVPNTWAFIHFHYTYPLGDQYTYIWRDVNFNWLAYPCGMSSNIYMPQILLEQ